MDQAFCRSEGSIAEVGVTWLYPLCLDTEEAAHRAAVLAVALAPVVHLVAVVALALEAVLAAVPAAAPAPVVALVVAPAVAPVALSSERRNTDYVRTVSCV